MSGFTALVLAGARGGEDPVARAAGVSHKGLAMVGGETLLARVVAALSAAGAERIAVCTNDADIEAAVVALALARPDAELETLAAAPSPSLSVAAALEQLGAPLLVTTVDHALLRPEWVARFLSDAPPEADIAALLAPEAVVRAAAPTTKRTYLAFADGRFSGCNLFLLATPHAAAALTLWRRVERHRKQPWKIAGLLGLDMLALYLTGRLTLDAAVRRLGDKAGVRAAAVRTPFGLAAVDVDKPGDLELVRSIVEGRPG